MNVPNGWRELDESENSSTVATFRGGGRCVSSDSGANQGDEVLIWEGTTRLVEEGENAPYEETVFEGFDDEIPEGAEYLVEVRQDNETVPVNNVFAETLSGAQQEAEQEMDNLEAGRY